MSLSLCIKKVKEKKKFGAGVGEGLIYLASDQRNGTASDPKKEKR